MPITTTTIYNGNTINFLIQVVVSYLESYNLIIELLVWSDGLKLHQALGQKRSDGVVDRTY